MATKTLPPQALLNQLLRYEPETGKLFWLERDDSLFKEGRRNPAKIWNTRFAGKEAFPASHCEGYCQGAIFGKKILAHRVIWKMVHGVEALEIDHINGNRSDNRLINLRSVDAKTNMKNMRRINRNTSGVTGIGWAKREGKWRARLSTDDVEYHIGYFTSFDEAVAARKAAETQYGFHENHGKAA